jgi:peptidylprolyl isomerase domain and WD repeat-containing protein 1
VLKVLKDLHFAPIRTLKFLSQLDLVVSTDDSGMIEIWDPETYEFPADEKRLQYCLISDTDFLELAKAKTFALSTAVSNNGEMLALYARDRKVRVFNIRTGKLIRTVDDNT